MNLLQFVSPNLFHNGPILEVWISGQSLEKGKQEYKFDKVAGLIDTGATFSCIDKRIVEKLNLISEETRENFTADGLGQNKIYNILFLFDINITATNSVRANEMDLSKLRDDNINIDFIVGRDILSKCTFTYKGLQNSFKIEY